MFGQLPAEASLVHKAIWRDESVHRPNHAPCTAAHIPLSRSEWDRRSRKSQVSFPEEYSHSECP